MPVAVPFNRKRFSQPNLELLHFKQILRSSIIQSVDGVSLALVSKAFLTAVIPHMFTISKETKIVLFGIISEFNLSITSKERLVSLILVSILLVSVSQTTSIKRDIFSMVVLHPVVKKRIWLISLCVLYSILFFPST